MNALDETSFLGNLFGLQYQFDAYLQVTRQVRHPVVDLLQMPKYLMEGQERRLLMLSLHSYYAGP